MDARNTLAGRSGRVHARRARTSLAEGVLPQRFSLVFRIPPSAAQGVTLVLSRCHKVTGSARIGCGADRKRGAARTQPVPAGRSVAHAPLIKPRRNDDPRKCASVFGRIDRSDCHTEAHRQVHRTG